MVKLDSRLNVANKLKRRHLFLNLNKLVLGCECMMVYLSTCAHPLYFTSDLRSIRYATLPNQYRTVGRKISRPEVPWADIAYRQFNLP